MEANTPVVNTDIRHEAVGNLAFLLSVIRCGEKLSEAEESNVRRVIKGLNQAQIDVPSTAPITPDEMRIDKLERMAKKSWDTFDRVVFQLAYGDLNNRACDADEPIPEGWYATVREAIDAAPEGK